VPPEAPRKLRGVLQSELEYRENALSYIGTIGGWGFALLRMPGV
jgi:hypothetical protein